MKRLSVLGIFFVLVSAPAFAQGWLGSLGINPGDDLSFSAGYVDHRNGAVIGFGDEEDSLRSGRHEYFGSRVSFPVRGVKLSLSGQKVVSPNTALVLSVSYLIPSLVDAVDTYDWQTVRQGFHTQARGWKADLQWWDVDGMGVFRPYEALSILGGFRYDSFQTCFSDPSSMQNIAGGLRGYPTDESDLTITCYVPYAGVQVNMGSPYGNLTVKAIGTPWLPGEVIYKNTVNAERPAGGVRFNRFSTSGSFSSAYLLELFAEYGLDIAGYRAALFGEYSLTHAVAHLEKERVQQPTGGSVLTDSDRFAFSFNRNVWVVGGKISIQLAGLL